MLAPLRTNLADEFRTVQRKNQQIEVISQRNGLGYTAAEKAFLERLDIKIVKEPKTLQIVDNETFVFGRDGWDSMRVQVYCCHNQPNLYMDNGAEGALDHLEKRYEAVSTSS